MAAPTLPKPPAKELAAIKARAVAAGFKPTAAAVLATYNRDAARQTARPLASPGPTGGIVEARRPAAPPRELPTAPSRGGQAGPGRGTVATPTRSDRQGPGRGGSSTWLPKPSSGVRSRYLGPYPGTPEEAAASRQAFVDQLAWLVDKIGGRTLPSQATSLVNLATAPTKVLNPILDAIFPRSGPPVHVDTMTPTQRAIIRRLHEAVR